LSEIIALSFVHWKGQILYIDTQKHVQQCLSTDIILKKEHHTPDKNVYSIFHYIC